MPHHSLPLLLLLLLEGVAVARLNRQALVHLASGGGSEASATYRTSPICSVSLSPGSSGMGGGGAKMMRIQMLNNPLLDVTITMFQR